jgi:hypothetical protein
MATAERFWTAGAGGGFAAPFVVYEPVEVVFAAAVERDPGCSPGESNMI